MQGRLRLAFWKILCAVMNDLPYPRPQMRYVNILSEVGSHEVILPFPKPEIHLLFYLFALNHLRFLLLSINDVVDLEGLFLSLSDGIANVVFLA